MIAFVSAPGLSLSSSRVFVTGTSLTPARVSNRNGLIDTEISAALPNIPFVGFIEGLKVKLPDNPFQKKSDTAPVPPPPNAKLQMIIGDQKIDITEKLKPNATRGKSALAAGLPKFYNPKTSRYEFQATAKGQNKTPFDCRVGREKNTTNTRVNENGTFRNTDPYTDDLLWARPGWSSDEARVGVRVALRNIFGNANLFESELAELAYPISCVTKTANMKEFVRAIALSEGYRKRFFEATSNLRFIECNFMHFLGRAPHNQAEISEHIRIINEEGYAAEINSYIDSDEYDTLFGDSRIPAVNFRGGHPYNNDMNKIAVLNKGYSTSDRIVKKAILVTGDASGFQPITIGKGMPEAWVGENMAREMAGPVMSFNSSIFWNPQPEGLREAELDWIARMGNWTQFWYKDSIVYKEVMAPGRNNTVEEVEEAVAILKYGSTMADKYIGCRWAYDVAPVIEMRAPSSPAVYNGQLSVKMREISFSIPADLEQKV